MSRRFWWKSKSLIDWGHQGHLLPFWNHFQESTRKNRLGLFGKWLSNRTNLSHEDCFIIVCKYINGRDCGMGFSPTSIHGSTFGPISGHFRIWLDSMGFRWIGVDWLASISFAVTLTDIFNQLDRTWLTTGPFMWLFMTSTLWDSLIVWHFRAINGD